MPKTVLVTGASGVVGRALVDVLRSQGQNIVTVSGRRDYNLEDAAAAAHLLPCKAE